ncbi:putative lipoprotein with Yx(FWY)xxD motif [Amycolatopsis bartoniae]|uniref:Lipoprotein n=1 Tax=Amycolatopsis bartoniae TaxID=941986 RepID=A0A8H9J2I1_9PSEU|nr:SCO0930 family lipoprotein [Amycolatopsis bartoniae]MBB2939074.1 putative lipoprotein with Yx(FWY)xxD motif [Amycolatopsis bartoniae]GHF65114.1 lipoprotein [Amycolatopsis bartoniae]
MSARLVLSVTAVAGLGLLGACSATTGASPAPTPAPTPVAVQRQAVAVQAKLVAADVAGLGQVLTDQDGHTLYRFEKDTANPPASTCEGTCATAWPPVLATGTVDVEGVDPKLVGTLTRGDGSTQVTVNGWPVYRYAKDTAAGQANGQDVGDTWHAVTPTGGKATTQEQQTAINTTNIPGLDTVLTDQNGRTLYLYTKDSKKPSKSTCDGACATAWPPLLAQGDVQVNGVDPKLVGKVTRGDGTVQVTIGGWPVYRYAKDTAAGQANGHAVNGVWFELEQNGCKVADGKKPLTTTGSPSSTAPAADPGGSSY